MTDQTLFKRFTAEITEVQSTLLVTTTDLTNPLGDLVRGHIKRSQAPICGAVVLAVAITPTADEADSDLRRKRIVLAAALEMLHIALNVHRLLVNAARQEANADSDEPLDRAFIGSTILAGDYCFSRAAQLAAQTDHPQVVATFSLALQSVSEGLLREQFETNSPAGTYDETRQLLESGALAAAQLINGTEREQQAAITLSRQLANQWASYTPRAIATEPSSLTAAPQLRPEPHQELPSGWRALYQWLNHQHTNGDRLHN